MLFKRISICFFLSFGLLFFSNLSNFVYATESLDQKSTFDQHTSVLFYQLDEMSINRCDEIIKSGLNINDEREPINFVVYDKNAKGHVVSKRSPQEVISKNYADPLSVENGQLLPSDGSFFKEGLEVFHTSILTPETRFWTKGTEQLPIGFPSIKSLEGDLKLSQSNKFRINDIKVLGGKIVATLDPDETTKKLRTKIIAPYSTFYEQSMQHVFSDKLSQILQSIRLAEKTNMEKLFKDAIPEVIAHLSAENDFSKENAAAFIVQFFDTISKKEISPYTYGWWIKPKELEEYAKGNGKIVCDYLAFSGPSFMKVMDEWKIYLSLTPLKARVEDVSKKRIEPKELAEIAKDPINQDIISKLQTIIKEKDIILTFQRVVFNNDKILTTFKF